MSISKYRKDKQLEIKKIAKAMYEQGMTLREIATFLEEKHNFKRSYEWIRKGIIELSPD